MFYYNYKWAITFKNCELLCGMPETYIICSPIPEASVTACQETNLSLQGSGLPQR